MNRDGETSAKLLELTQRVEALEKEREQIIVSVCEMKESNGNCWFSVMLQKNNKQSIFDSYQVYSSTIKGRAEYEAEKLKHTLGQAPNPNILDFETDEVINQPT